MKKISDMQMEEYGKTAEEIMVAGAMKLYIQSIEPKEALRKDGGKGFFADKTPDNDGICRVVQLLKKCSQNNGKKEQ